MLTSTSTILLSKIVSLLLLAVFSLLSALLPLQLSKSSSRRAGQSASSSCPSSHKFIQKRVQAGHHGRSRATGKTLLQVLLNFSGGVLLATCFLHLIPDVREEFERSLAANNKLASLFPVAELTVCLGYFAIYAIEELVEFVLSPTTSSGSRPTCHQQFHDVDVHSSASSSNSQDDCTKIRYMVSPAGDHVDLLVQPECLTSNVRDCQTHKKTIQQKSVSLSSSPNEHCTLLHVHVTGEARQACRWTKSIDYESTRSPPSPPPVRPVLPDLPLPRQVQQVSKDVDVMEDNKVRGTLRSMMLIVGLSFHSIFEGMAIGLQTDESSVWMAFVAVAMHKFIMAFCVGVKVNDSVNSTNRNGYNNKMSLYAACMIPFCLVSPIGIAIGTALTELSSSSAEVADAGNAGGSVTIAVLQGLASGTLIYVTFFEILAKRSHDDHSGTKDKSTGAWTPLLNFLAVFVGFALIAGVQTLDGGHQIAAKTP